MEFELQQLAGRAVRDDQEDADKRDQHAGELPARCRLALDHPGAQQHEQRGGRVEQHGIDRRGGLESKIDQGLEYGHAGEREQRQQAGVAPQRRARSRELGQGKRRKHQHRDQPAPEIERHRLERVAQRASNDPVPRPKEVCQRKQRKGRRAQLSVAHVVTADSHCAKVNRWQPPEYECRPARCADRPGGGAVSDRGGLPATAGAGARAREEAARTSGTRRYRAAAARIAGAFLHLRAAGLRIFLLAPLGLSRSSCSFRLLRHPGSASEAVHSIAARVHRTGEGIAVTYSLEGQLARLRIPPPRPPRIATRLWQHTCCEIFIARKGLPGYQEFNLAPSGEWAAYAFARYREGVPLVDEKLDPRITVRSSGEKLELDAFIRVDRAVLSLSLAAAVGDEHWALAYLGLKHSPGRPDL